MPPLGLPTDSALLTLQRRIAELERETARLRRALEAAPLSLREDLEDQRIAALNLAADAEEARQKAERNEQAAAHLAAVVHSSQDAIIGKTLDGTITSWNPGAEKLYGYSAAEIVGKSIATIIPVENARELLTYLDKIRGGEAIPSFQAVRVHKDGRRIDVSLAISPIRNDQGQVVGASAIAHDISEQKKWVAALKHSEEFNRSLVESSQDCIKTLDLKGNLLSMSSGGQRLMEIADLGSLLRKSWIDFWKEADRSRVAEAVAAAATGAGGRFQAACPSASGRPHWWDVIVSPICGADGQIERLLAVSREITGQKQAEDLVNRLNAELEQRVQDRTAELEAANKELEAFAYSVSHDLRSPLRAIDGFSRILLEDYAALLPEDGQRYLRMARENTQRMGQLIDDLLAFSRLGRHPLQKMSIAPTPLVRTVLADLQDETAGREVEVVLGDLPSCQADPALLKQVFTNLLTNAFKFTRAQPAARIEIGFRDDSAAGEQTYFVKDNGAGFDMQYAQKLFGVFQRLHRAEDYPGTGVGLAIVQRIIHRHGGRVWAEGAVNRGATFYFALAKAP